MFVLFLFQCIQLTSNVFWQLNFFILFFFFLMIILRLVVVNSVRSIWMLIPIIHCGYPQNFWICIVLDITFLPFTVSTSIIKEYVVLCNCLVTFISVYYLQNYVKSMTYYHLFEHNCVGWCSCFYIQKLFFFEFVSVRMQIQYHLADFTFLVILRVFIRNYLFHHALK